MAITRSEKNGTLNYFSAHAENIFVKVNGSRAKLVGQSRVEAAVFGGGKNVWKLQLAFDAEKRAGTWILLHGKASTY